MVNILAVGDVVGQNGLEYLTRNLYSLQREYDAAFTVVNAENAQGRGLFSTDADAVFDAGADVITLGNHAYSKREICDYLDETANIIRPANYAAAAPGVGECTVERAFGSVRVICLIGRKDLDYSPDNPFVTASRLLADGTSTITLVDFHAEATSEKKALAWYLDGKVSAFWGTHTHVQTSDARVLPGGTGYVTDLGMTGPADSVIGMDVRQSVNMFLGLPKDSYRAAAGICVIEGAVFSVDELSGKCASVRIFRR
ncbi:MAG: YmdB family metallophosphoesterase [Oscillospiraceae bacterium]|nr:YmdB family metallophosphoesterase [Oscillospiraceae bacterium]